MRLLDTDVAPYVSTGELPSPKQVRRSLDEAYQRYRSETAGELSQVDPALARVPAPPVRHLLGRHPRRPLRGR